MSEDKRTITVTVHEGSEKPDHLTYAYVDTEVGWTVCRYLLSGTHFSTAMGTATLPSGIWMAVDGWPVSRAGRWVELKDIAQAAKEAKPLEIEGFETAIRDMD